MAKLHRRVPKLPNPHLIVALAVACSAASARAQEVLPEDAPEVQRLAALAAQLGDADGARREAARSTLTTLGPDQLPAIRGRIAGLRRGRPPRNWAVDVMSRFRRRGRTDDLSPPDLVVGAMQELAQTHRLPRERERVVAMAEPALLWAALDRMNTLEAQRAAFPLLALDDGLWEPEGRHWVRRRGDDLLAAALRARGDGNRFVRDWGRYAYEATGADDPGRAIPSADVERLPDVLTAYAGARVQSAMRVVVSYTGHPRRAVRRAARDAMAAFGGNAVWILRTAHRNETGEHPPRDWGWERVASAIYAHQDARRMEPVRTALEAGTAARDAGDLDAMRRAFDDVLARMPELEHPGPVADGYGRLAERALAAGDLDRAEADYRRALRLAPAGDGAHAWRAGLARVEARRAAARGIVDEALVLRVLEVAPEEPAALAALARLEPAGATAPRDDSPARARWAMAAALILGLLGLALLWRPARTRSPRIDDTIDEADATLPDAA